MEKRILLTECSDDVGLIAKITNVCSLFHFNVIRQDQFASHEDSKFFMSDKNLVIKDADGKIEKFDIVKTYPVDPKDVKINELEQEIKELKELINNEYAKSNKPTQNGTGPDSNDIINAEPPTKTTSKSVSKKA